MTLLAAQAAKATLQALTDATPRRVLAAQALPLIAAAARLGARGSATRQATASPQAFGHERVTLHLEAGFSLSFTLLLIPLNRKRRLALALEIIRVVVDEIVAAVGAAGRVGFAHQISALLIDEDVTASVDAAAGDGGGTLERAVMDEGVLDELARGGAQGGHVGVADGLDGRVARVDVAAGERGVVRAVVVVGWADGVEKINGVSLGKALAVAAVSGARLAPNHVEWTVRHVAGEALQEGAGRTRGALLLRLAGVAVAAATGVRLVVLVRPGGWTTGAGAADR